MKSAVWVTWSETWATPLLALNPVKGLDLNRAEVMAKQAKMQRQLIAAVPVGNA